jgi:molybdopterin-synthase adenylyltransferase
MDMRRPRIKNPHRPFLRPSGKIWIGSMHYGLGTEIDDESGLVWSVCARMDGSRTKDAVIEEVALEEGADLADIAEIVEFLIDSGWVEDLGVDPPPNLSAAEIERYARNAQFLSWIDCKPRSSPYELQSRLKASRVTVLGLGGIGSAVAMSLASSGVGHLQCVDGDVVELSNLNRQILFTEADIGHRKVARAVERLQAMNSDIDVTGTDLMVGGVDDIARVMAGSDVLLQCADRPKDIDHWANEAALRLGIPWIFAAYTGPMLSVGTFIPGATGCYVCLRHGEDARLASAGLADIQGRASADGFNPVMAPTAQMTGHFAAMEAIYLLLGMEVRTAGHKIHRNFLDYDHQYYIDAVPQPDCPMCSGARLAGVTRG